VKQTMLILVKVTLTLDEWLDWLTRDVYPQLPRPSQRLWQTVDGKEVLSIGRRTLGNIYTVRFITKEEAEYPGGHTTDLYFNPADMPKECAS